MSEDKSLTLRPDVSVANRGLTPRNMDEAWRMSTALSQSSLVPTAYRGKPEDVLVALQMGLEVGLAPMQALQSIAVINSRPSIYGDAGLALVQGHPAFESISETWEGSGESMLATCTLKRRGMPATVRRFSVADAKHSRLWGKKGPWSEYPKRMLQMRARWWAMRDAFADALSGIQGAEEVIDIPTVETITPEQADEITVLLQKTESNVDAFLKWVGAPDVESIPATKYAQVMALLQRKLHQQAQDPPQEPEENNPPTDDRKITQAQHKRLEARLKEAGVDREKVKSDFGLEHLTDMTRDQYSAIDSMLDRITTPTTTEE